MDYKIIGLVGPIACGKGVVADYLIKKHGFTSFSLSRIVHNELEKRGITKFTRSTLQDIGDELRKKEGEGVLAKRAIESLKVLRPESPKSNVPRSTFHVQRIIIEGIRNPGEVEYLCTLPNFLLIAVDAPQKVRFERVMQRGKPWDPKDWKSFLAVDGRDKGDSTNGKGQQVRKCMDMADVKIENAGSVKAVQILVRQTLDSRL